MTTGTFRKYDQGGKTEVGQRITDTRHEDYEKMTNYF